MKPGWIGFIAGAFVWGPTCFLCGVLFHRAAARASHRTRLTLELPDGTALGIGAADRTPDSTPSPFLN